MELLALLALGLAFAVFIRSNGDRQKIEHLDRGLSEAFRRIAALTDESQALRGAHPADAAEPVPAPAIVDLAQPVAAPETVVLPQAEPEPAMQAAPPPREAPVAAKSLEESLTSRWLVWVGALAIALSGTFLVRYAIERGLLGPAARVTLGFLLGAALIALGEWLRRRPLERAIAAIRTNHVPPALTASGLFIAFASIYAAYALYDLLAPLVAFGGLALIAFLGVGLSLLQGRFVALMGLLGAFTAPALIVTPDPSAWNLFFYLLVVELACLAVARVQSWWWLALSTLAGVVLWPFLWMMGAQWTAADGLPLGLFLLFTAGAFFALRRGMPEPEGRDDWVGQVRNFDMPEWVVWVAACAVAFVQFAVVNWSGYAPTALVLSGLLAALYIFMGRRSAVFDSLPVVAAVLALAIAVTMSGPRDVISAVQHFRPGSFAFRYFEITLVSFGALFAVSGFVALWGAKRPALWAAVSAAMPVLLLTAAYWRMTALRVDASWAVLALVLAGLSAFAVERIERYRLARGLENALAFYAAATVALVSLAAAMMVREAWLTVALAIQVPALAWIGRRIRVGSIQVIAAIVVVIVLVRLVLNYNVFFYPLAENPALSWVVYGYGVPALSFYAAARMFRTGGDGRLIALLEAASLAFAVLLVSLEIRLFVAGSIGAPHYGLLEESLHSIAWMSIAAALAAYTRRNANTVLSTGALLLAAGAATQIVLLQLLVSNPLLTGESVGRLPVLNVLFLAYAVPAFFTFRFGSALSGTRFADAGRAAGVLGFILVFAYVSLETTRAFEGAMFDWPHHGDAELYAYSIVWLVYAVILLVLGIVLSRSLLRYASLAVLIVTVLKVFPIDMAGLTGLYRVGSFLGLGLSLIGIGYIYQRFVFPRPAPARPDAR